MDPTVYFSMIAPQLLALIDGDDPDLNKAAAYVVGSGILGKRAYGTPGTIGHSIFVKPIFSTLTAELDDSTRQWITTRRGPHKELPRGVLIDDTTINLAIDRLSSLTLQHPNPGLVKRLVYPILLPLWGLACYVHEQQNATLHEKVMTLLHTYFGISVGVQPLKKLIDHLLWDGGSTWEYSQEKNGGICLKRHHVTNESQPNFIRLMDTLQSRVDLFVSLLGSDPSSEERTGDIFLYVSETWLLQPSTAQRSPERLKLPGETEGADDVLHKLVSAKIAEKLMDDFKDTLSRRPLRVLDLVNQVIAGERQRADARRRRSTGVSLSSLANVVNKEDGEQAEVSTEGSTESLSAVFSLLSTVLASPEFSASQELVPVIQAIKAQLDQLIPHLPSSLAKPATTSSMLLEIHLTTPDQPTTETSKPSSQFTDLDTHRQALTNLNSDLPPVQAEGFALLSDLVKKSSPVLDIPSTLTLLLSIITDTSNIAASDEFIYLNAIKLVGTLASRHPRTVIKNLVDRYADRREDLTLDQRLKLGESLLRTVQDLGDALTGETAKIIGEGMVAVAGRRGHKPEAQKRRRQQMEKERREKEREERQNREPAMPEGFSISSPAINSGPDSHPLDDDDEEDSETEPPEQMEHSANIIAAWAAGTTGDNQEPDDLRARTSALSILGAAVQTNIAGLGPSIASSAVDLSLSTLALEPGSESAILRRASVVLLLDILKALDSARGSAGVGFGFSLADDQTNNRGPGTIGNIPHMLRMLQYVEGRETDGIVRGHIRVLIESLEAWMEKTLLYGIGAQGLDDEKDEPRLELGDRIAGLDLDPMAGREGGQRPRIEEIE